MTQANESKAETKDAEEEEKVKQLLNEWQIEKRIGTMDIVTFLEDKIQSKEIDKLIDNHDDTYDVEVNGYVCIVTKDGKFIEKGHKTVSREGLNVGDYIDYTPDINTEGYSADNLGRDITGYRNEDLVQETLNWQILRIYKDGSMDLIGSPTSQELVFEGEIGYNNGVTVMNDICEALYSRGEIKARNVRMEDMEFWLTDEGKTKRANYLSYTGGPTYGHTQTYLKHGYPNLYAQEKGAKIDSGATNGIDIEEGNETGLNISDEGIASGKTSGTDNTNLTVTQSYYELGIKSANYGEAEKIFYSSEKSYWFASRYVRCHDNGANFGLYAADIAIGGYDMFIGSNGGTAYFDVPSVRPVVTLGPNAQITACSGTNSTTNMHTITKY